MQSKRFAYGLASILILAVAAQAASPSLSVIQPRGVTRGGEAVLTFSGARLQDAEEIFFYEPGVQATKIEPIDANQIKVTVAVAADCRLGEHTAQVRTKTGISDYRTFYVGALPDVAEVEPNSEFDAPQAIALNVTVSGVVQSEDVDYYVIEAKKGQRIAAEVEAMRLGSRLFDPYVAILDSKRFELSAADDTPLVRQDAVAAIVAPEDGKYVIEVRESAYGGDGGSQYRLHVGTFPRPTAVYPAGGKLGEEIEVTFIGDPAGDFKQKVTPPAEPNEEYGLFATDAGGIAPSDNPFRLYEHGNALEVEPNNELAQATPAQLPLAFNGIIQADDDIDCFKFAAKKGEVYEIECYARRIRSALDPVLNLYYADGRGIAGNDDARGPDSYIRFSVPADGEYIVRVTDHLGRGGRDFVYRVEFQPVRPQLTLGIPRVTRYGQDRQQIFVPRGGRYGTLVSASRANFGGDIVLDPAGLPAGVTMVAEPMPANLSVMPVVFEAAADAPIDGDLIVFKGRHADPNTGINGHFTNRADFIIGAPGQSLYSWKDVAKLPVAVVDELPFALEIVQPNVALVQNGSMQLKVVAKRKEGFTAAINVQFPFRPPGIGAASSVAIPEGQNEVLYPLSANGNAQAGKWPVFALGSADVGGAGWVSSQMAHLEVATPYVNLALQRADVEQGKETQILAKVEQLKPFEGAAKVELLGVPAHVTVEPLEMTKDTQELIFKVKTTAESPEGTHKTLFCRVTITANGEPIEHSRVGGTELRIDKPLPPPKEQPLPTPATQQVAEKPPEPQKPPEKPLSRLEKLRLEAKAKAEGGGE
ncbi:MAG: PPC domain-containing protein [Planctomycetes bacterium]|nr:PPC domain-containing protein [Planctomycetota bacterium]